jgi:hypothetical protein
VSGAKPVASGASADHVLPFQRAEDSPVIATHEVAETQDTGPGVPDSRRVPGIGDQRDPSHASASDPAPMGMSVTQNRRAVHDTLPPTRCGRIDQVEPFQVAKRSDWLPLPEEYVPVARQNRGEPHETSEKMLWPPGGDATGSTDQAAPFQRSARSRVGPGRDRASNPTAVQADQEVHDTESSCPAPGEGTMLQLAAAAPPMPLKHRATMTHTPAPQARAAVRPSLRNT